MDVGGGGVCVCVGGVTGENKRWRAGGQAGQ